MEPHLPANLVADPPEAQLPDDDPRKRHRADQRGILRAFECFGIDVLLDDGGSGTDRCIRISGRQCSVVIRNMRRMLTRQRTKTRPCCQLHSRDDISTHRGEDPGISMIHVRLHSRSFLAERCPESRLLDFDGDGVGVGSTLRLA